MERLPAQDKWSFVYDYDQFHMWEEIYLTPVLNGNVLYSAGDIHIANGEVVYDDCGNRADKRVYRKLGTPLSDNWSLDFDFTPTAGGPQGVAHILAGLTAGTENPYNIVPTEVFQQHPSFSPTNQDGIFFEYISSLYANPSNYYLRVRVKDGTTYEGPSASITMAPDNQVHYLQMERSGDDVYIREYSDAARTNQTAVVSVQISGSITGLNVLQHSNIPQGGYDRKLTATLDNFTLFDASLPCVRCGDIALTPSSNQNYILQKTARIPVASESAFQALTNDDDIWAEVGYVDGLGRPLQEISVAAAPGVGTDLISYHRYDEIGREAVIDLPYVANNANGSFRDDGSGGLPSTDQLSFYNTSFPHIPAYDRSTPFAETQFEASPLNRVIEQGFPGRDWQTEPNSPGIQSSNEHTVVTEYLVNSASVSAFKTGDGPGAGAHSYPAGSLYITKNLDENGHETETYTDKAGRTLVVRKESGSGWAETHYVYDEFGRVKYIVQPQGWEISNSLSPTVLSDFTFQYVYDARGRVIEKKIPGSDWHYMVYNKLDQVVFTQDGNLRADNGKWLFTKYDGLGRPIITGVYFTFGTGTRSSLQSSVDASTDLFETRDGSNAQLKGYTNNALPNILGYVELHSVTHYDDYDYNLDGYPEGGSYTAPGYFIAQEPSSRNKGLVTEVEVAVLNPDMDMNSWLKTKTYYDKYGREIETVADNAQNGVDRIYNEYSFSGELLSSSHLQTANFNSGSYQFTHQVMKAYSYDPRGRLLRTEQKIWDVQNPNPTTPEFISLCEQNYDPIGQLKQKKIHYKAGENFLQIGDHEYNIRGWLKTYNMPSDIPISGTPADNDLFSFGFVYNDPGWIQTVTETQYNGNIAYMAWQVPSNGGDIQTYDLLYDELNRLITANYVEFDYTNYTPTLIPTTFGRYNLSIPSYDKNGNIKSLLRLGKTGTSSYGTMDDLTYTYTNGNQLVAVSDGGQANIVQDVQHFVDGNSSGNDYSYDANGNLEKDLNVQIDSIDYNHLNKPFKIHYNSGSFIEYIYDATGSKLRQRVYDVTPQTPTTKVVDYLGSFQFEDNSGTPVLLFYSHEEGRARNDGAGLEFINECMLKDHLGNVRVMFADINEDGFVEPDPVNGEVLQIDHYYPFGMRMSFDGSSSVTGNPPNNYLYNGKELQSDLNLNWYDYGARMYDASIARWNGVDFLAEKMNELSPYNYVTNNPLIFIDPDGNEPTNCCPGGFNPFAEQKLYMDMTFDLNAMIATATKWMDNIYVSFTGKAETEVFNNGNITRNLKGNPVTVNNKGSQVTSNTTTIGFNSQGWLDLRPVNESGTSSTPPIVIVENKTKETFDITTSIKVEVPGSNHSISLTHSKDLETGEVVTLINSFSGDRSNTAGVFSSYSINENGDTKAKAGLKVQSPKIKVGKTTFSGSLETGLTSTNNN